MRLTVRIFANFRQSLRILFLFFSSSPIAESQPDQKDKRDRMLDERSDKVFYQFQIKDAVKAARIEATKAYHQYAKEPKTSQRRGRFDLELESDPLSSCRAGYS